jgi:hypothetical protein
MSVPKLGEHPTMLQTPYEIAPSSPSTISHSDSEADLPWLDPRPSDPGPVPWAAGTGDRRFPTRKRQMSLSTPVMVWSSYHFQIADYAYPHTTAHSVRSTSPPLCFAYRSSAAQGSHYPS